MRVLTIGDVHGCITALRTVTAAAGLGPDDLLVTLGDYVDRGPDSRAVLDWLIERPFGGEIVTLRGNHDVMMLDARADSDMLAGWLLCGGDATLESYARQGGLDAWQAVSDEHWDFLKKTHRFYETETHIFVHATVHPKLDMKDQDDLALFWEKLSDPRPHRSGKTVICGHTAQHDGVPRAFSTPKHSAHTICIDTWVYGDGWLTCLDIEEGRYWQGNEAGQTRSGQLF